MAYKNKAIHNPKTGQSILFLRTAKDTDGTLLEMETSYRPHSVLPAEHYHPRQEEVFHVLKGELTICLDGKIKILSAGQSLHINKSIPHAMWNASDEDTVVKWKVMPAMDTEYLLETMTGLACDNKTNEKGMPSFLQTVLIAKRFSGVLRLSKPPYVLQSVLFSVLSPLGRLLRYKSLYKKYID